MTCTLPRRTPDKVLAYLYPERPPARYPMYGVQGLRAGRQSVVARVRADGASR